MENIDAPPVASSSFLTPLLISMLGIVCTSLCILAYHFILVKYCLRRRQRTTNTMSQPVPDRCLPAGVDQKILETIPIMPYLTNKSDLFRVDQSECVVCLGELEEGDMVRLLPICRHAFHVPCIDKWFLAHTSCPVCRCPTNVSTDEPFSPSPASRDESNRNELSSFQNHDQRGNITDNTNPYSSEVQSCSMLRHCLSLALPMERRSSSRRLITGLKRSLSMDQSFIVIDIQRSECQRQCSSSSSSSSFTRSVLNRAWSVKQFDRVSSKLIRSVSQLRGGKGSGILPY